MTIAIGLDGSPIQAGVEVVIDRIEDGLAFMERWELWKAGSKTLKNS